MLIFLNRTGFNGLFRLNRQRRLQRAGRTLHQPAHLRRDAPARRWRAALGAAAA